MAKKLTIDERDLIAVDIPDAKIIFRQPIVGEDDHPCFALSPDGTRAIVSAGGQVCCGISLAKRSSGPTRAATYAHAHEKKAADANHCWEVAFSADGRWALEAAAVRSTLFDVETGRGVRTLALPFGTALAFSPDGAQLLAGGPAPTAGASSLELWDVARGARVRVLAARGETTWSPGPPTVSAR